MALNYGFFNSVRNSEGIGDRRHDAKWFAKYFASFIGNGIFPNPSTGMQVVEQENMTVAVKIGQGWINGYYIDNDADYLLTLENAHGLLHRIDRVVLRWNQIERIIELIVKEGQFSSSPVPPVLQRDGDYYELCLAEVTVKNGITQITQSSIKDTRLNKTLCGIVHGVVNQVDTTTLFNQYHTWFAEQMAKYAQDIDAWTTAQQQAFLDWIASQQTDMNLWTDEQRQAYLDWISQQQIDMTVWTSDQQQAFLDWMAQQQAYYDSWSAAERDSFLTWFNDLQTILDGDVATNLASRLLVLETTDTSFRVESDANKNVFITFPNHFFHVDENGKVFYMQNGDGNAGASFGEKIYVWKVM